MKFRRAIIGILSFNYTFAYTIVVFQKLQSIIIILLTLKRFSYPPSPKKLVIAFQIFEKSHFLSYSVDDMNNLTETASNWLQSSCQPAFSDVVFSMNLEALECLKQLESRVKMSFDMHK